jgi:uncharacterized protein
LSAVAAWAARHAKAVLAVSLLLSLSAAVLATRVSTEAGPETLVDADATSYRATQQVQDAFGEEPVVVLAEGDLQRLILTSNLGRLLRLEGCLSADPPPRAKPIPGPCAELARLRPVESVLGPATFLNEAVIQVDRQLRRLVARTPPRRLRELLLSVAARYGITSVPSLANPDFLAAVVFDLRRPRGTPKARLAYLFPNGRTTQIVVRLKPDLGEAERRRALELIRAAVLDPTPRRACRFRGEPEPCFDLRGGRYVVSGVPLVVEGVAAALEDALLVLLAVAVVAMALTLLVVFRSRLPLLPLAIALAAAALTFGLLELVGGSLTMASIAVLPILIGLAVDYAIQFQARCDEAVEDGVAGVEAARLAAQRGGPAIATACLATAAGFLALQLSPTPMVRDFGLLLIVGIAIAFVLALTLGFAVLSQRRNGVSGGWHGDGVLARSLRGRGSRLHDRTRPPQRLLALALSRPKRVLGVGLALAVLGWVAGTQVDTVSDIRELAPQDIAAVRDLNQLQEATGVSGQLDVSVRARDLTNPATLRWMAGFKQRVLEAGGFSGPDPSCLEAEICPGPALSDFVVAAGGALTRQEIRAAFAQVPAYDLEKLARLDPETGTPAGTALLSFGIRAQSLDDQQRLIERVRGEIGEPGTEEGPPPGVEVELAGLPVVAAAAASDLSDSRWLLTLAGLLAVAFVLLAVYRSARRALVPLLPIVLATGWGALLLWVAGVPLNPMSAALGALTIAIATEFSVLLSARFHEERGRGNPLAEALRSAYARTGAAVLASGITATVGFAVLLVSDVRMLREFGFVTVIDLGAALIGVFVALPAALVWVEESWPGWLQPARRSEQGR